MATVRDIMTVDVVSATQDMSMTDVIRMMTEKDLSCVVVMEEDRPQGIITETDLVRKVLYNKKDPKSLKVKDVMTSPIISIHPDIDFADALGVMHANKIKKLVVVEDEEVAGIVTNYDFVSKTKDITNYNKKLLFYQNVQSYVIFIFFLFIVIYLVVKYIL